MDLANRITLTKEEINAKINTLVSQTALEARPYQHRIMAKSLDAFFNQQFRSVMIDSPTGSGKTATVLCVAKIMQEIYPDLAIGWVNMRRNLLTQAKQENEKMKIGVNMDMISMFAKELPPTLIAGTEKAATKRMLIIDEGQHDAANSMAHIHSRVEADFVLSMSATCYRSDCQKLLFDTIIKDASLGTLIKDGYLAQYHHYTLPTWDVPAVTTCYLCDKQKWGPSLFYFHRLEQAHEAALILQRAGTTAEVVTGSSDREAQLDRFREGKTEALVNCMVLTEGFNDSHISTVFVKPSCKSVTIQACGRAFRKHPDLPYKQIVQAKKGWPFIKLAQPLQQYVWEANEWRSLTLNPKINEVHRRVLVALSQTNTALPDFLVKAAMKGPGRQRRQRANLNGDND